MRDRQQPPQKSSSVTQRRPADPAGLAPAVPAAPDLAAEAAPPLRPDDLLGMQHALGNQAVQRQLARRARPPAVALSAGPTALQRVGGMANDANYCFMNSVVQLLEVSYSDLFDSGKNVVAKERQPIQTALWQIILDLRANKDISQERVTKLRGDLKALNLVTDSVRQEDAQEFLARIINYMVEGSTNFYPHTQGLMLSWNKTTESQESDIVAPVPSAEQTKGPSKLAEKETQFGNSIVPIDINVYNSFEDFLYYLYGVGTKFTLGKSEYLKVLHKDQQVYVNARTEKYSFSAIPAVITFYIKRFTGNLKNSRNFPMPGEMILVEQSGDGKKRYKKYRLEATVRHQGATLSGGHYYAVKRNEKQAWTAFSDMGKGEPAKDEMSQGSLYTYRLAEIKDSLADKEVAYQETKSLTSVAPNLSGVDPLLLGGLSSSTAKHSGGQKDVVGFSPFLNQSAVASDTIRGLPNRARKDPISQQDRVVDCFINAIMQLVAGSYLPLFDASKNPLADPAAQQIQAAVYALVQKINNADKNPIGEDDIFKLRTLLGTHKLVESLYRQEDAAQLMQLLLGIVLDVQGRALAVPGKKDPVGAKAGDTPGKIAKASGISVEQLVSGNPLLSDYFITISSQRRMSAADIDKPPQGVNPKRGWITGWQEEAEPSQNVIEVDIGQIANFEEFLFQRYGQEWEATSFDKQEDYPQYSVELADKTPKQNVRFKKTSKRQRFTHLPPTISFLIKRFTRDASATKKDTRDYSLPPTLVLVEEPQGQEKVYKRYDLAAVVVHTGGQLESGHYYTHRKEGKDWLKANDKDVWAESGPGRDISQGYLYTYRLSGQSKALPAGYQAPQEKYNLPEPVFQADSKLRPTAATGYAGPPKHRNSQAQASVSGEVNLLIGEFFPKASGVFHAGHLLTSTLGGAGDARNLVPMWHSYNTGSYANFEDNTLTKQYARADEAKKKLYIRVEAEYPAGDGLEEVFADLLSSVDIKQLRLYYDKPDGDYLKEISSEKLDLNKQKLERQRQIAAGVKNYLPHLIRTFRRIPVRVLNSELRVVTFDQHGTYLSRSGNLGAAIKGSPRAGLGPLNFNAFVWEDDGSARAPQISLYGDGKLPDLKGQDPDEWVVKTYADMPEPGVFQYHVDSGRASGVDAYIWMDPEGVFSTYKFGGGTEDAGPAPAGFDWRLLNQARRARGSNTKIYVRGHLLNGKLHGSGNDPNNLTPLTQDANKEMSRVFEEHIKGAAALTTPGRGILWSARMSGKVARSSELTNHIEGLRKKPPKKLKESEALWIDLADEEAKLFSHISLMAYEAIVQLDGTIKRGQLIHSAVIENAFSGDSGYLGNTIYQSLFGTPFDRFMAIASLKSKFGANVSSEKGALQYLSDAIAEEHEQANEKYLKDPPRFATGSDSVSGDQMGKDAQALLSQRLASYHKRYKIYAAAQDKHSKLRKEIVKHNQQVHGFDRRKTFQARRHKELSAAAERLRKAQSVIGYDQLKGDYDTLYADYRLLLASAKHVLFLTGKKGDYSIIGEPLESIKDIEPDTLETDPVVLAPKGQKKSDRSSDGSDSSSSDSGSLPRPAKKKLKVSKSRSKANTKGGQPPTQKKQKVFQFDPSIYTEDDESD